jgi:hypothetical protein
MYALFGQGVVTPYLVLFGRYFPRTPPPWLDLAVDSIIAIAYYIVPLSLIYFIGKRGGLPVCGTFGAARQSRLEEVARELRQELAESKQAQVELAASDEPAFDRPGAVAACVNLTKQGWMARAKFIPAWDRWIIEARQKAWPTDRWATLRKDGAVRLKDGQAEPVSARRTRWQDDLRQPTEDQEQVDERAG